MSLRIRLLLSFVFIAVVVLAIFGAVAYTIAYDSGLRKGESMLDSYAKSTGKVLAYAYRSSSDIDGLSRHLRDFQDGNILLVIHDGGRVVATSDELSKSAQDERPVFDLPVSSRGRGTATRGDDTYLWASAPIDGSPYTLLAISDVRNGLTSPVETLSTKLLVTAMVVIWVAVWGALILSASISRRLSQQHSVLVHQAMHDALTALPNRNLLQDRVSRAIEARVSDNGISALFMMDLDRFKEVNDTLGHDSGDQLLIQVGDRVRSVLRDTDTVARLGGDEFAVLLPVTSNEQAMQVAGRIQQVMSEPFNICNVMLDIDISIGIALCPVHGDNAETLIKRADIAMYQAKREGRDYMVYDTEADPHSLRRLTLTTELRCAIETGSLSLCYQPKASMATGEVLGMEALCRWHSERFGHIAPDEFIALAENSGLIKPLTQWVMRAALAQCGHWRERGMDIPVAVNLSARNLHDPDLPEQVERLLTETGVPSGCLELEITESAVMADASYALGILTRLHNMGVRLAIDDFGTGHSSLAYLKRLPVDEIKVDKSFVLELPEDGDNAVIVRAIIELAHNMGRVVVAEGIENQSVWDWLECNGCDIAQGYFLGKPMAAPDFEAWLHDRQAGGSGVRQVTLMQGR